GDGQAQLGAGSDDGDAGHNNPFAKPELAETMDLDRSIQFENRIGLSGSRYPRYHRKWIGQSDC
ncbi:hypothetical protein, partial [Streptomyces mirabilis]